MNDPIDPDAAKVRPDQKFQTSPEALKLIKAFEPAYPYFARDPDQSDPKIICSHCFSNVGLSIEATKLGSVLDTPCARCGSSTGHQLNSAEAMILAYRFYVLGSVEKIDYGCFPSVVFNEYQSSSEELISSIGSDARVFEEELKVGFFEYGPNSWMHGNIDTLERLRRKRDRPEIVDKLLKTYPSSELGPGQIFFRVRINPSSPSSPLQYDSPPEEVTTQGRFESKQVSVLYASPDIDTCIHECRTSVDDAIFAATLNPTASLKLLDLTVMLEEDGSPYESLDLAVHYIFRAAHHSYDITRDIARSARTMGYDGILFPSYFSALRTGSPPFQTVWGLPVRQIPQLRRSLAHDVVPNIAIFGHPVREGKLEIVSINRVFLERAYFSTRFAPVFK